MKNYAVNRYSDASPLIHKPCAGLVAAASALALSAGAASAATITVKTILDEFDGVPNANCSLREAIESANQNASLGGCPGLVPCGNDTIVFDAGVTSARLSIITPNGADYDNNAYLDLDIGAANSGDLTIQGGIGGVSAQPVAVNWADRVFDIVTSASVALTGLTIQGDARSFKFETGFGEPCFGSGGGIHEQSAQLLIENSAILSNTTEPARATTAPACGWAACSANRSSAAPLPINQADTSGSCLYQDAASRGLIVLTSVMLSNTSGAFLRSTGSGRTRDGAVARLAAGHGQALRNGPAEGKNDE